jgi:tRNA (mo5U34)-methyltransferase
MESFPTPFTYIGPTAAEKKEAKARIDKFLSSAESSDLTSVEKQKILDDSNLGCSPISATKTQSRDVFVFDAHEPAKRWWHTIDFGDGVFSDGLKRNRLPLEKRSNYEIELWGLTPQLFANKSVLDIGCNDGKFSFLAEEWGATEVVAIDAGIKKTSRIAKKLKNSKVKFIENDIQKVIPEEVGTFDVVMNLGVLYHMKFPFLSLHVTSGLTKKGGTLILESHRHQSPENVMRFYPGTEINGDYSTWWGPTKTCISSMLEVCGFKIDRHLEEGDRVLFYATKIKDITFEDVSYYQKHMSPLR